MVFRLVPPERRPACAGARILLLAALTALSARLPAAGVEPLDCRDCSVILLSIDTLRADFLGAYGSSRGASPHIDRLAGRGVLFESAFSQSPITLPSHMSIFTSRYPTFHGVQVPLVDSLDPATATLPEILRGHGYHTLWAVRGGNEHLDPRAGFGRGFAESLAPDSSWDNVVRWLGENRGKRFFMFLHISGSSGVHDPYCPDEDLARRFVGDIDPEKTVSREELWRLTEAKILSEPAAVFDPKTIESHPEIFGIEDPSKRWQAIRRFHSPKNAHTSFFEILRELYWRRFDLNEEEDLRYLRGLYAARVWDVDRKVGLLYAALERTGLARKTLLVITSDHGEEFMEHGGTLHIQLYRETLHVPLIFVFPDMRSGARVPGIAQSVDILPTILDALRLPVPETAQGRSLLSRIADRAASTPDTSSRLLKTIGKRDSPEPMRSKGVGMKLSGAEEGPVYAFASWSPQYSVRDSRYTYLLILDPGRGPGALREELYDRRRDPGESRNVLAEAPEIARRFRRVLAGHLTEGGKRPAVQWPAWLRERTKGRLLRDGYW